MDAGQALEAGQDIGDLFNTILVAIQEKYLNITKYQGHLSKIGEISACRPGDRFLNSGVIQANGGARIV